LNILFLTQVLPYPLDAGPKIRSFYTLRFLAKSHSITLLSFVRPTDSATAIRFITQFCKSVKTVAMPRSRWLDLFAGLKSVLYHKPFLISRDELKGMDQQIKEIVKVDRFDVIHADQLWMAPYALKARTYAEAVGYSPKLVLDQHNAVYLIPQRMAKATKNEILKPLFQREAKLMAAYEANVCGRFDRVAWVTQEDLDSVLSNIKDNHRKAQIPSGNELVQKSAVIPICVDPGERRRVSLLPDARCILFLGGMHWPPNADGISWFAREIFPIVIKVYPDAELNAIGKQPPEILKSLGANVVAPGYLEDVEPFWKKARVFVVPLRSGGGMRVKILDAWSKGVPVVSTTIGAEGIKYNSGKNILIADTPEAFARAVGQVLSNPDLAEQVGNAGRETLEKSYDWEKIYLAWDGIYSDLSLH